MDRERPEDLYRLTLSRQIWILVRDHPSITPARAARIELASLGFGVQVAALAFARKKQSGLGLDRNA